VRNIQKIIAVVGVVATMLGCGGGGGDAKAPSSTALSNKLSVFVVDARGSVVNGITYGGGQRIRATYTDSDGNPLTQKTISFAVSTNPGAVTLAKTTESTGNSGQAFVAVSPATPSSSGAATVTATVGGLTSTVDFAVSGTPVMVGSLVFGNSSIGASGNTTVSASVTAGGYAVAGVNVSFTASCGSVTPSNPGSNSTGTVAAVYSAIQADGTSCRGTVTIRAIGPDDEAIGTITVAAPVASAINFVSAVPSQIYVIGSGASTQSIVKFRVLDPTGAVASGADVKVSLVNNPSGVSFDTAGGKTPLTLTSDRNGLVAVTLFASSLPGPVQVRAELSADSTIYAFSQNLTVWSGPPSQDHFSVSVGNTNLEGKDWEGTTTDIVVFLADRQGNAVAAGTVVNFTASGGQIGGNCVVTLSNNISSCTTKFASQNPRGSNGRVAILAYTEGVKNYVDVNGNGIFDSGDTLTDMGDAYRDDDESGGYTAGEFVLGHGGSATCLGSGRPYPSRANTCDPTKTAATVRQQVMLFMSGSHAARGSPIVKTLTSVKFDLFDDTDFGLGGVGNPKIYRNPMPFGTTIAVTVTGSAGCTVVSTSPSVVPAVAPSAPDRTESPIWTAQGTAITITLKGCAAGDVVNTVVTTPKGVITRFDDTLP